MHQDASTWQPPRDGVAGPSPEAGSTSSAFIERNPKLHKRFIGGMQNVAEIRRHAAPGARPQPLAFHNGTLWVGSWETHHLYAIDPSSWKVLDEVAAPGQPFGLASFDGAIRAVVGLEDDNRYMFTVVPGRGFDESSKTPCDDFTGSHLATDGKTLYLGQMGKRRIVELDAKGGIVRAIALPSHCGGMNFGPDGFYIISADEEFEVLQFGRIDIAQTAPPFDPIASFDFGARALAYDGKKWWTCDREENYIVEF